ncbi:Predicted arabinose efflux permease, MFS family [Zhouia amylolytica]|uniref:Arabinose efflux permease family protein n=2 Tax=Zhouia amylolytica TaxID=376730 RepID=W2UKF7_9FLAO|nr:MFS transporter [Zhouia amylolytica]ETN94484.1 arabinose efflux permease family protein [Zhouia amylolytica AD3]MCQ0110287.1 MFS transporter [Zhouia amylolytica]SFT12820.1 Predicted arabinose efflux permease, MFS family [Zhouia amylolytica]
MKKIPALNNSHPVYNLKLGLVCVSSLLFSASYNMLIPELPAYLTSLGGARYIGLIIALFTLTAGVSRPFSGKLTDTVGRIPIMIFGTVVCVICGLLYPLLHTVFGFLLLRLLHGFSTGFKPTATSAYVADITPAKFWGTAIGMQSLFYSTGMAVGPALGSLIKMNYSYNILFYVSSVCALLSMLVILNMKETLESKQKFKWNLLQIQRSDIIAFEVLPAAFVVLLVYVSFGVILTLIPDWTAHLGIANKGMFFIVFTVSSLLIRFIAGKASDTYGRKILIIIGLVFLIVALLLLGMASSVLIFIIGAVLYGIAMGILSPSLNAWTIDMSLKHARGKAVATMYIALEAGIGLGALFSGWYYQGNIGNIPVVMYAISAIAFIGLLYMLIKKGKEA